MKERFTMKKTIIFCISILLISVMFLSSCDTDVVVPEDTTDVVDNGEDFDGIWLVEDGKPVFDIICSEYAVLDKSPELAQTLAGCLESVCGVEFSVYSDKAQAKNDSLIVFGDPSDKTVLTQMNEMNKGGYSLTKKERKCTLHAQ